MNEYEFAKLVAENFFPSSREENTPRGKRIRKILRGEYYTRKSKLPKQKSTKFIGRILGKTISPLRGRESTFGGEILPPLFVLGYTVGRGISYEIWYDPYRDTYVIIDNHMTDHGHYRELYNAADALIELIALEEDLTPEEKAELEQYKDVALRKARQEQMRKVRNMFDSTLPIDKRYILTEEEESDIRGIMAGSASAETLITKLPGVVKYNKTKLTYNGIKRLVKALGSRRVETPMQIIGSGAFRRLEMDDANGYFIGGFSLPVGGGSIDLEIWYLAKPGKKPMFYVFNVTSYKMVGEVAKLRNAYALVAKVLGKEITNV